MTATALPFAPAVCAQRAWHHVFPSPVGPLAVAVDDDGAVLAIGFGGRLGASLPADLPRQPSPQRCREVVAQLDGFLHLRRRTFDLALRPLGTPFQLAVWRELTRIPYGGTISYAELARRIGRPTAVRAVGAANGRNPIPIVIPCHRVIGKDGRLVGFGGGLQAKRVLLGLESAMR